MKNMTPLMEEAIVDKDEIKKYQQSVRRQKIKSALLVTPLFVFLVIFFILPISFMLYKSFYNPKVADLVPITIEGLSTWDYEKLSVPDEEVFKKLAYELQAIQKQRLSGVLAEEVNRRVAQTGSVIKRTARKLKKIDLAQVVSYKDLLISLHSQWGKAKIWRAILSSSSRLTINYYAHALDYSLQLDGSIVKKDESERVYLPILLRTFKIALIITILTFSLGYPLAYYLATISTSKASMLLILVLLPFWTSLLVRTTAWIAILQADGVANQLLLSLKIISTPLEIIYNQFATILSMTHILLPFMILPLYSVMRGIDPSYMKASQSLGANPVTAFFTIYFPLSMPGLSAGALLVFIIAVGYYITPALLGGVDGQLISNLVAHHMRSTNNWELAAALGAILLISILVLYWIYDRLIGASNIKL